MCSEEEEERVKKKKELSVTEGDHQRGGDAEGGAAIEGLFFIESHDEDDFDKEERNGEEPIDI